MLQTSVMFIHHWQFEVEWGDCDAAGIVFYPQYFRYFDAATSRLFDAALKMRKPQWTALHGVIGVPLVDAHANFKRPATFGDVLDVESAVETVSRSSITIRHRMRLGDALILEGSEKRVWAGRNPEQPKGMVAIAIPDDVRAVLTAS